MDNKEIQGTIFEWVSDNFGRSEAEDPSWNIEGLANHLANQFDKNWITLFKHKTTGGAVYLTDNHKFSDAKVIIRLDGGAELVNCEIKETE